MSRRAQKTRGAPVPSLTGSAPGDAASSIGPIIPCVPAPTSPYEPTARDVMRYAHVTVTPDERLARAHERMHVYRAEALVVLAGDAVLGVVTSRALHRVRASSRLVTARDLMNTAVLVVDPQTTMRDAVRAAGEQACTHVVVVQQQRVIGEFAVNAVQPDFPWTSRPVRVAALRRRSR